MCNRYHWDKISFHSIDVDKFSNVRWILVSWSRQFVNDESIERRKFPAQICQEKNRRRNEFLYFWYFWRLSSLSLCSLISNMVFKWSLKSGSQKWLWMAAKQKLFATFYEAQKRHSNCYMKSFKERELIACFVISAPRNGCMR